MSKFVILVLAKILKLLQRFHFMKQILLSTLLSVLLVSFGCQKNRQVTTYLFQDVSATEQHSIYIDDEYRGKLPFLNEEPNCDDSQVQTESMKINIQRGRHTYKLVDADGNIVVVGKFQIAKSGISASVEQGIVRVDRAENCAVLKFSDHE